MVLPIEHLIESRSQAINYTHLFPTRYALELEGLKGTVSAETFKEPTQREDAKKTIKKLFEERYVSGKNRWFFTALRVRPFICVAFRVNPDEFRSPIVLIYSCSLTYYYMPHVLRYHHHMKHPFAQGIIMTFIWDRNCDVTSEVYNFWRDSGTLR